MFADDLAALWERVRVGAAEPESQLVSARSIVASIADRPFRAPAVDAPHMTTPLVREPVGFSLDDLARAYIRGLADEFRAEPFAEVWSAFNAFSTITERMAPEPHEDRNIYAVRAYERVRFRYDPGTGFPDGVYIEIVEPLTVEITDD